MKADAVDPGVGDLAAGFAQHVERWARARLAGDAAALAAVRQAAFDLSLATSEGHVCLALADRGDVAPLRAALLASGVVGTAATAAGAEAPPALPLVLDAEDRLYLHRDFDYEQRLARRLVRAATAAPLALDDATIDLLDTLFAANAALLAGRADWQKIAAAVALRRRLVVISGGPGTGKTTTVVNLLACLLAQDPGCRIALAAPTGKAAARMTEAIRQRAVHLPPELSRRLPTQSSTIHRLLGVKPRGAGFVHHAGRPLAIDALVVDEASMLDLALATRLLEAVPDGARIILLGDKDQLAAVESGAVFSEISADPALGADARAELARVCGLAPATLDIPPAGAAPLLPDSVVWFTHNFRFAADSGIGRLAADINGARADAAIAWLASAADPALRWIDDAGPAPSATAMRELLGGYAPYFDAVRQAPADRAAVAAAFGRFRALCAVRAGPRGVAALNEAVSLQARAQLAGAGADVLSPWYPGRPVMVLENDYVLKLFNGDIGYALPDAAGELLVWFADAAAGFRAIAPLRLPAHQTAFAMTVHKAQGSEFDDVLLMLPAQPNRVVTRELLYTALTRARRRATLCATPAVLRAGIETATRRNSGLLARLRDVQAVAARDTRAPD